MPSPPPTLFLAFLLHLHRFSSLWRLTLSLTPPSNHWTAPKGTKVPYISTTLLRLKCTTSASPTSLLEPHLGNELPLLVHADIESCLCSTDSNSAPKSVSFHNELCCQGSHAMVTTSVTSVFHSFTWSAGPGLCPNPGTNAPRARNRKHRIAPAHFAKH